MTEAETETADPNTCEYKGMTVTYKRCEVLTDDYGNSALFVYFDFTNNSEDTESFYMNFMPKIFAAGVEINDIVVTMIDSREKDNVLLSLEIQP